MSVNLKRGIGTPVSYTHLSARQQPAVSQPSSDAELSFEPTGVKTVRPVGRPKKQTAPPAEEQTAVRIGRVVQGEPYRKQRGRRPKDNRDGAEQRDPEISATTVETEVARPSTREMRGDSQEGMKRHRRDRITAVSYTHLDVYKRQL